jgi:CHAT domain-containing protein/TPR repeat protein
MADSDLLDRKFTHRDEGGIDMPHARVYGSSIIGRRWLPLALCLACCLPLVAAAQSADETMLRTLTERFFAAYQAKDLDGLMLMWSAKSADLAASKQSLQQSLAAVEKIELQSLAIRKITVDGDQASLRVALEINAVEVKTGKPQGLKKLNRTLQFIKAGGEWKVWRYVSSEEALAAALAAAKTEAEQKTLLAGDQDLITVELQRMLITQGNSYTLRGSYAEAMGLYQIALSMAEQLGDKLGIATALRLTGVIHLFQSRHVQALEFFQKSLKLAEEIGDKQNICRVWAALGSVESLKGAYTRALEYYQKSLTLAEEIGDKTTITIMLANIGGIHSFQGNFPQALEYQYKSLKLAEEMGNKRNISNALIYIAGITCVQGNYTQALEVYQRSLKIAEEAGDKRSMSLTLNGIGSVHELQGNYTQALEYYQKSLKLAEEMGESLSVARLLHTIGSLYNTQGNYLGALEVAQRATTIARQFDGAEPFWQSRTTAGIAYRGLNRPEQARQAFTDAIDSIEKLRSQVAGGEQQQQRFFEYHISPYYEMVGLLIDQNKAAEALAYAERAKGRVLLDVLSSGKVNITKAMTPIEQEQERKLNGEIVSFNSQVYREKAQPQSDEAHLVDLNARLQKARLDYEAFQTNLYAAHPELKTQRGETPPLTLKESAALIPDAHTALLEFVVMEDKSYLFVLTKNQDAAHAAPDLQVYILNIKQKELADRTHRFRQRLASLDVSFADLAGSLYDCLLKPAQAQLRLKTALVIVPDGVLWELPFQALMSARNRYLIEDGAISYAPSLTVLREMTKLRRSHPALASAQPTLLAFGNPVIGKETTARVQSMLMDEKLLPLPEAEHQVKLLGQLYGTAQSRIYVGVEAREDRVKAEAARYRILHLATHGILNDASPMYSQVVLSQSAEDPNNDGLLEAWEIMNLDLKADLVILSACETARGRVGAGEGLIGLSWALFVAGCPTTVVSQWKVESVSTTELMSEFHRHLKAIMDNRGVRMSKAEALRQAALKLLRGRQYSHPFYWAAFVVVGDGR